MSAKARKADAQFTLSTTHNRPGAALVRSTSFVMIESIVQLIPRYPVAAPCLFGRLEKLRVIKRCQSHIYEFSAITTVR